MRNVFVLVAIVVIAGCAGNPQPVPQEQAFCEAATDTAPRLVGASNTTTAAVAAVCGTTAVASR
jgi:hypothetical protein